MLDGTTVCLVWAGGGQQLPCAAHSWLCRRQNSPQNCETGGCTPKLDQPDGVSVETLLRKGSEC